MPLFPNVRRNADPYRTTWPRSLKVAMTPERWKNCPLCDNGWVNTFLWQTEGLLETVIVYAAHAETI